MNAELIAVGSEMLTPQRVDTNSLFLTEQLNNLGVEVIGKSVIGDNREHLADKVRHASGRAEIVFLGGGLGPTEDDVTREAVALALDRKLIYHAEIVDQIEQRFLKMGRKMADINKRQGFIIEGAEMLTNDRGTAPGQWIEDSGRLVVLLPGPPNEMKAMFTRQCLPRLERVVPKQVIRSVTFRVSGMSESELDASISPIYMRYSNVATTVLAHNSDIQIHFRARCARESEAIAVLAEITPQVELILGDRIYSRNGDTLEATIGRMLRERRATLAVAESATGGGLAERITAVPGSSDYFLGGMITYSAKLKTELLGVPVDVIEKVGTVSEEVARAMAIGARRQTGSTYALSITGNAGPAVEGAATVAAVSGLRSTPLAPLGMIYTALATPSGTNAVSRQFFGDRPRIRAFASQMALDLLRRRMEKGE